MIAPAEPRLLAVSSSADPLTLREPAMGNAIDRRPGIRLTSRYPVRDGIPWIPVSGEIHYSRVPRHRWVERIRQMKAGGITVIACYVPWLHHVPERGAPLFTGNLDVASFVDEVRAAGLEVVLRIGPWAHGEMRNGGFPDWVQDAPVRHRTDDPEYLSLVTEWWGQLGAALDGRCNPSNVLAIQLENELYDQPHHIVTLKGIARESGLSAVLWTATAWGGAQLPETEVLPVYGGYGDGFWVDQDQPWHPSFRQHYFFSDVWDDPGIGADVRGNAPVASAHPSTVFPAATCEIGGGMATAYHRRPRPTALDVAAVAHCKIGNGSAWQGFYMYAGGTNLPGGTQESQATGYPNDVPALSYDFHAPIGEAGDLAPSHAALRRQHAFLDAFGDRLARMPSHLPQERPDGVVDSTTLRWAFRGDDREGFLFIAWHQPHIPLEAYRGARFRVSLGHDDVEFPSRPVDIPPGTLATWPVGLSVGGVAVRWATASVLTELRGETPTLVLSAEEGIPVELAFGPGSTVAAPTSDVVHADGAVVWSSTPGLEPIRVTTDGSALDVLVLPATAAAQVWVQASARGDGPRLLLSEDELSRDTTGAIQARTTRTGASVRAYDSARRSFIDLAMLRVHDDTAGADHAVEAFRADVAVQSVRPAASRVPAEYGRLRNRLSAPDAVLFETACGVYELSLPAGATDTDALLRIDWAGDVAELVVDGRTVSDRFWDGSPWRVNLRDAGISHDSTLELRVLPLSPHSPVHLPEDAAARLAAASGPLVAVDAVTVERRSSWLEDPLSFQSDLVRG